MLVSAAVCPHPPMLVPEIAGPSRQRLAPLHAAALSALDAVRATEPELLVIVGAGPATDVDRQVAAVDFAQFGVDHVVRLRGVDSGVAGDASLPLSLSIGVWLVAEGGWTGAVTTATIDAAASAEECVRVGAELADRADRVALLVMSDGTACRSEAAPRPYDSRAEAFDSDIAAALAAGDPEAILALDGSLARELGVEGLAALDVLAGAAGDAVVDTDVTYDDAPFGVGYVVAVWERHG
ncbi:MAG TPA: class III extradiol dioxygenase subunit B-like domain-containing protein [Jiangellaceae bacterium]|nr:class III extradiol dioxygenase subunit B-like domain-containing protein [Jiangellaceae bacterium]